MKRYPKYFLICLCMVASLAGWGQKTETIISSFKEYQQNNLQEKVYVHCDRDFYLTGEIMWFKVYCVDGSFHKPLGVSKVAYLEILNGENRSMLHAKMELDEDGGDGSIFIPATLASGNYRLRAYTNWMRNYSSDYYFQKDITIINPFVRPETEKPRAATKLQMEFFPEGGNLVEGLRSVVGFKIIGASDDTSYKGTIVDNENDSILSIAPFKFGLGKFSLTPQAGKSYSCILEDERGKKSNFPLPRVYPEGYVMHVMDSIPGKINVVVNFKGTTQSPYTYLFVHSRQRIVHAEAKAYSSSSSIVYSIDKSKFPDGITHLTLFNEDLKPICERLYFAKHNAPLQIAIESENKTYSLRRKVRLNLNASVAGKPSPAGLSVAVYKVDSLTSLAKGEIASYFGITSDLRGTIEHPEYYMGESPEAKEALDNLMLTHGWRKFEWDNILSRKSTMTFVPEYRSHIVTGKVLKSDGTPAANVFTFLSSPGKQINLYTSRSNAQGDIYFEVHNFNGSRKMILQTVNKQDSTVKLEINNPYSTEFSSLPVRPFKITPSMRQQLKARSLAMQVQDIYYRDESDKSIRTRYDSLPFYGIGDQNYNLDDYTRFPVLEEVMREYVPGVLVRKRKDGFHFLVIDNINRGILPEDPLILLDGVPVLNLNRLMDFDPLRIKRLEVVMRNFYLGSLRIPGIVSYTTYQGDMAGFELDSRSVVMDYEGLQFQRQYYNPKYENSSQRGNRLPDQRTLLYWIPTIKTGSDGTSFVEFYTSDVPGDYQIVVEGMSKEGHAGSALNTFSVRRADF